MVETKMIQEWINKADEDFEFASINLKERKPFYAQICFHFHQAAEKYLKAYVVAHGLEFRKIHDLRVLLKTSLLQDPSLEELLESCEYLNAFYVEARYPVLWPTNYSYDETYKAYESANRIRSMIKDKLI